MKIVVVGKPGCVWCDRTKNLLHHYDVEFTYIEAKGEMRDFLVANNLLTVPQVFDEGKLIGGHDTLAVYLAEKLVKGQLEFKFDN
jgi:glutaredoxin